MKTETYDYTSIDEAIKRLQKLKAEGKILKMFLFSL